MCNGTNVQQCTPVQVALSDGALQVSTGDAHSCALLSNGTTQCWGRNDFGQVGDGVDLENDDGLSHDRAVPTAVLGLADVVEIQAAGGHHTCALTGQGSLYCWGRNYYGTLGDGTLVDRSIPVLVRGFAAHCGDGVLNGDEVGVDCDGACLPCE